MLLLAIIATLQHSAAAGGVSAGYLLGGENLTALSAAATTLPVNRLYLAFVSPTMYYVPGQ